MASRRALPTSFTAGRDITLEGTTYARGATIPGAVVARVRRVSAYLSRRWILPHPEGYLSKVRSKVTRPEYLNPQETQKVAAE
jgi:hypothetical protein